VNQNDKRMKKKTAIFFNNRELTRYHPFQLKRVKEIFRQQFQEKTQHNLIKLSSDSRRISFKLINIQIIPLVRLPSEIKRNETRKGHWILHGKP